MESEKLSEINTRAVTREPNELIGEIKMAKGDVINFGYVMKCIYIVDEIWCGLQSKGANCRDL